MAIAARAVAGIVPTATTKKRTRSDYGMLFVVFSMIDEKTLIMKRLPLLALPILLLTLLASCSSVRVASDYDRQADFSQYNSYAFYKTGIDRAEISDLDKKRILRAIETEMASRGFQKSMDPDILVSIFTKEKQRVDIYNNRFGPGWGWGWGWNAWGPWGPWGWGNFYGNNVSTRTEGTLFIDLIDTKTNELVWQGKGVGTISPDQSIEKKEARIRQFVSQILEQYPPGTLASN